MGSKETDSVNSVSPLSHHAWKQLHILAAKFREKYAAQIIQRRKERDEKTA